MVSGYVGIYRRKEGTGGQTGCPRGREARPIGGAPPTLVDATSALFCGSQVSSAYFAPKIYLEMFHFVWTPFDIPFR